MRTADAARGRWYGILRSCGVDENFLRNRAGPCPLCGGRDRYRWDNHNDEGGFYCNACGAGDGFALLMGVKGWTFQEAATEVDALVANTDLPVRAVPQPQDPLIRLRKIARSLAPMDGINPVRLYLQSRGLKPSQATRYCPAMPYYEEGRMQAQYPAMIHILQAPDGSPVTYHVTYLTTEGRKAPVSCPKKLVTPHGSMDGAAIRLCPICPTIAIAEGVETALAVQASRGISAWAATSANLMEKFQPPEGVRRVEIFADADENYVGQAAAHILARRLHREGYSVDVHVPSKQGTDFADEVAHGR